MQNFQEKFNHLIKDIPGDSTAGFLTRTGLKLSGFQKK